MKNCLTYNPCRHRPTEHWTRHNFFVSVVTFSADGRWGEMVNVVIHNRAKKRYIYLILFHQSIIHNYRMCCRCENEKNSPLHTREKLDCRAMRAIGNLLRTAKAKVKKKIQKYDNVCSHFKYRQFVPFSRLLIRVRNVIESDRQIAKHFSEAKNVGEHHKIICLRLMKTFSAFPTSILASYLRP